MRNTSSIAAISLLSSLALVATALNGVNVNPPDCASRCMVDSMFITSCVDNNCLCRSRTYQQSLFQCLFAQCDPSSYGPALLHAVGLCVATGAEIYMSAAPGIDRAIMDAQETEYLAGRLELRQESVGGQGFGGGGDGPVSTETTTSYVTVTSFITGTEEPGARITPFPGISASAAPAETSFFESNNTATMSRPWVISGEGVKERPSYGSLAMCFAAMLGLDFYINGF